MVLRVFSRIYDEYHYYNIYFFITTSTSFDELGEIFFTPMEPSRILVMVYNKEPPRTTNLFFISTNVGGNHKSIMR